MNRRSFVKSTALGGASLAAFHLPTGAHTPDESETLAAELPVAQLTKGAYQHWFGYYDKLQVDPTGRFVLGCQVDSFYRSPTPTDQIRIGLIDLESNSRWTEIGKSSSWGWQQGCMLQWIPGSREQIIWNDYSNDQFISKIFNSKTESLVEIPMPIYTLSSDGTFALSVNFARLQFFRPGYGYASRVPNSTWPKAPADDGIFKVDLVTGATQLILSLEEIAEIARPQGSVTANFHWFNHLLISPDDKRFIFLNRSRPVANLADMDEYLRANPVAKDNKFSSRYVTRAMTATCDGSAVYPLVDSGMFSHFIWNGPQKICAWAVPNGGSTPAFFDFRDQSQEYAEVGAGVMTRNGHNTYVPNTNYEWILNDTYPQGKERLQELYLYHVPTKRKVTLGKFHSPTAFRGEWRCDLHPRCDQQGHRVYFDSTHQDGRRQIYSVDIRDIVTS
ncbi:MAG: hypothetical protein AAGA85_07115 [Bacteroidota bacterium]